MPTFDIVIPSYNAAHFLPQALDSVIAQTFTDWRILLVDDGSTDSTAEVVRPYQEALGEKLVYIRQQNTGMSGARNRAFRDATAEFIAMLDADDLYTPERLQRTYEVASSRPRAALFYGYVARIDKSGNLIDTFETPNPHGDGCVAPYLYKRMLDLPCPTVSFRRSALAEAGNFDEKLWASEDRDLWIRIALRHEVALVPHRLALYRLSPNSMSTYVDRMTASQHLLIRRYYGQPGCGWVARRVALSWIYRQRAEALASQGKHTEAFVTALRALCFYPFQFLTLKTAAAILLRRRGAVGPAQV